MVRIWRQIYAINGKKAPSEGNRNQTMRCPRQEMPDSSLPLVVVEEEGEQVKPKCSHEMPVDAEGFKPHHVSAMNHPLVNSYSIYNQVDESKCQVQNVHRDQGPQVAATRVGSAGNVPCDGANHQGVIGRIKRFPLRAVHQWKSISVHHVIFPVDAQDPPSWPQCCSNGTSQHRIRVR